MKKLLIALGLGALMMGTSAMADPENQAIVLNRGDAWTCNMYVQGIGLVKGGDPHIVRNNNNMKATCRLTVPEEYAPAKTINIKDSGFGCSLMFLDEEGTSGLILIGEMKRHMLITPSGEARFECSFKSNDPNNPF